MGLRMRRLLDRRIGLALVILGIFAAMVYMASDFTYTSRILPLVIGIPGMILATLQLAIEFRRVMREDAARPGAQSGAEALDPPTRLRRLGMPLVYIMALAAGIVLFGFLIAAPLFIAGFVWLREHDSRHVIAMASIATLAMIYVSLEVLLGLTFNSGRILPVLFG